MLLLLFAMLLILAAVMHSVPLLILAIAVLFASFLIRHPNERYKR